MIIDKKDFQRNLCKGKDLVIDVNFFLEIQKDVLKQNDIIIISLV